MQRVAPRDTSRDFRPHDQFDRRIQRQFVDPHRDACMPTGIAKRLHQQLGSPVDDLSLLRETLGRLHVAFDTQDPGDEIEIADARLDLSERVRWLGRPLSNTR